MFLEVWEFREYSWKSVSCCPFSKGVLTMATLPLADCARLLGIHPKTLCHWLKQANIPFAAHPTDARIKCVTEEHLQQIAKLHGRLLQSSVPLNAASPPLVSSQAGAWSLPENEVEPTSTPQADLLQKLTSLETKVAALQEQLAQLALALLQEREQFVERRISTLETITAQLMGRPSLPASLPDQEIVPAEPKRVGVLHSLRQLNPAEQRARSRMPPLVEYAADGSYVIVSSQEGELHLFPDSQEWFDWLATLSSFRFVGKSGRFTAYRELRRSGPTRMWTAHRSFHQQRYKQ
jgi:DNA-binding transcriptional MerR regulator